MIQCPRCGGPNTVSLSRAGSRRPRVKRGIIIRQHRCGDCALEFRSYQLAINDRLAAEALLDIVEGIA